MKDRGYTRDQLATPFSHLGSSYLNIISILSLKCLPHFQRLPFVFFDVLGVIWEWKESHKRDHSSWIIYMSVSSVYKQLSRWLHSPDGCWWSNWNKKLFGDTWLYNAQKGVIGRQCMTQNGTETLGTVVLWVMGIWIDCTNEMVENGSNPKL